MFEAFSDRARASVALAQEESQLLGHPAIGSEHLLLGLLREGRGPAAAALSSLGVTLPAARNRLAATAGPGLGQAGLMPFTPEARRCLELGRREATQLGHDHVGTEHILLGLAADAASGAARLLAELGADAASVRQRVLQSIPAGLVPDLAELEDQIERVRRDTEAAIDAHDFRTAEALSDTEHELMAERDRRSRQQTAAPQAPDPVGSLQAEVDRLHDLLRSRGIDPGTATAS